MPWYLYRVLIPEQDKAACPVIEIQHHCDQKITVDPLYGYPVERVYTVPNICNKYSEGQTKQLLSDKSLAQKGFSKYVRDPISNTYVKTTGAQGPNTFKVH